MDYFKTAKQIVREDAIKKGYVIDPVIEKMLASFKRNHEWYKRQEHESTESTQAEIEAEMNYLMDAESAREINRSRR